MPADGLLKRVSLALGAIGVAAALYRRMLRRTILTWGATDAEAEVRLPGDELLEQADGVATRAITIDAPASAVWPWIAQMGPSPRGGAYTYDWIENLLGLTCTAPTTCCPSTNTHSSETPSATARTACESNVSSPSTCSPGAPRTATGSGALCSPSATGKPD